MLFKRKSSATVIGLDLGSYSLKMAEVDHSGKFPQLVNYGVTELVPGAIRGGRIQDRAAVVEALAVLFDSCQVAGRQVNLALSGAEVIIKTIQIDRMTGEELQKVIGWEAEQHVPFPLAEISFDYQVLDPQADSPQMNVLLVAAKRDLIEERLALLEEAGCEVIVMDVDTFALLNALEAGCDPPSEGCHAIVHFGHESTQLGLVRGGLPILTRNLPVGGRNLVELIMGRAGVSEDEAYLALLGQNGGEGAAPVATAAALDLSLLFGGLLDDVIIGVNRAAAFLESTAEGGSIARIYLGGGCAAIPGLDRYFEDRVGVPTQIANPLERIAFRPGLFQAEPPERVAPALMLALGLGLRLPG